MPHPTSTARRFWNTNAWNRFRYTLWAPVYDRVVGGFGACRRRSIEQAALGAGQRVLLVGAGTGLDLPWFPAGVEVAAVDLTPAMLRRARTRAAGQGWRVHALVMDGQCLAFRDATFDAAVLHLILAVIPDPVHCLREVSRVLRPGARAVVFDKFAPDGGPAPWWMRALQPVAKLVSSELTRQLGPMLRASGFLLEREEPAAAAGWFKIALIRKANRAGLEGSGATRGAGRGHESGVRTDHEPQRDRQEPPEAPPEK